MTKEANTRYSETVQYIAGIDGVPAAAARDKLNDWRQHAAPWEQTRILKAMHFGKGPNSSVGSREKRRAIILLRTAILRHDLSKVKTETSHLGNTESTLLSTLKGYIQAAVATITLPSDMQVRMLQKEHEVISERATRIARFRAQVTPAYQALQQATQRRSALDKLLYVPVNDQNDAAIKSGVETFTKTMPLREPNCRNLDDLSNGGELYIMGHGNMGKGIGSHNTHHGAQSLTRMLTADRLPTNAAAPLWIYLWSCWGGTHARRAFGLIGKREPLARRLARTMAAAGYNNVFIVGFSGSINASADLVTDLDYGEQEIAHTTKQAHEAYVVYKVNNNDYNRIHPTFRTLSRYFKF